MNPTYLRSNIIEEIDAKKEIKEIMNIIANTISKSLGPYGATTIIQGLNDSEHFMTKDGYTILKHMHFYHDIPKTILDIIKKISKSLVRTVGDGSTSAIVVANSLFDYLSGLSLKKELSPHDIIFILNELSEILNEYIYNASHKINEENLLTEITKIATISNNNDIETGQLIAEIYSKIGRFGFINLESGDKLKDRYEIEQGIEVNRGWINQRMTTETDGITAQVEKPYIFMCNDMLDDGEMDFISKMVQSICISKNSPLIIIAANYSSSFKSFFDANLQRNSKLKLYAIDIDCSTKKARDKFEDLALVLGCKYYDKFSSYGEVGLDKDTFLGMCERAIITDNHSMFIEGIGLKSWKEDIDRRIEDLENEYNKYLKIDYSYDRENQLFNIKKRIASLRNSTATLYVGGNSEIERRTRKFLIEDSIFACRSALEYGYVVGGNLIVPKIINKYSDDIINKLIDSGKLDYLNKNNEDLHDIIFSIIFYINNSFKESYRTVLKNSLLDDETISDIISECIKNDKIYNLKTHKYEYDNETNIINSAQTDIEIIKACFSIIGLLATSNQFLMLNAISLKE